MGDAIVILLLAVHLLAMNVAAAGPLVAAWLAHGVGERADALARRVARRSLAAMAIGAALGGGLLLAPNAGLRAALARFPASTYWFAAAELGFSAACMAILAWAVGARRKRPLIAWGLALAATSNLLYHFPPLMAVIGKLAADPRWATEESINRAALVRLATRPEMLALWVHFALASLAAAAIAAQWPVRSEAAGDASNAVFRRLAGLALVASLVQLPVGLWLLLASGGAERDAMLGQGVAASASFLGGVVAAIALLQTLAIGAMGEVAPAVRRRTGWLLLVVATLMTATLTTSRRASTRSSASGEGAAAQANDDRTATLATEIRAGF